MKIKILHILFAVTLLIGSMTEISAQYSGEAFIVDRGIYDIRMSTIPNFRYKYDDYLQYSPAALMIGLKACGYESRSSWGRMMVSSNKSGGCEPRIPLLQASSVMSSTIMRPPPMLGMLMVYPSDSVSKSVRKSP